MTEKVSSLAEAELRELGEQVESVLRLAGLPARITDLLREEFVPGAVISVETLEPDSGVFVHWRTTNVLHQAGVAARDRQEWEDVVQVFDRDVDSTIMPETLIRVLEAAGLRAYPDEWQIKVEGRLPDGLKALIES